MDPTSEDKPKASTLKKWLRYLDENSKWIIYELMVGFMVVAASAYWLNVAYRSRHDILAALYAGSIVLTLVFRFAGLFRKTKWFIVVLVMLTLIFLLAFLY